MGRKDWLDNYLKIQEALHKSAASKERRVKNVDRRANRSSDSLGAPLLDQNPNDQVAPTDQDKFKMPQLKKRGITKVISQAEKLELVPIP